jgi:NitT/TauT family transport system permease protein
MPESIPNPDIEAVKEPQLALEEQQELEQQRFEEAKIGQAERRQRKRKLDLRVFDTLPVRVAFVLLSLGIFLALWQLFTNLEGNIALIAGPLPVIAALGRLLGNQVPIGAAGLENIYTAILRTVEIIGAGFGLSLIGIPIGLVMGRWKAAESIIDPWINAIYSIPMVALIPIMYFAIGTGFLGVVFVSFILAVFTVIINTYSGVKYTSSSLAEVGKTFGASELQFLGKVILPASLPDIVAGMRLGLGRAVLGAFVAQALLSRTDLGNMLVLFNEILDTPDLMAIIFIIAAIGILALQTPKILERYMFKWKEGERLSRGIKR